MANCITDLMNLMTGNYLQIEIWSENDLKARNLRPFVDEFIGALRQGHPEIRIYYHGRTNELHNFSHPFIAGQCYGYMIAVSSNIDPYALKEACMQKETDNLGNRMMDIDVYHANGVKVSRRP